MKTQSKGFLKLIILVAFLILAAGVGESALSYIKTGIVSVNTQDSSKELNVNGTIFFQPQVPIVTDTYIHNTYLDQAAPIAIREGVAFVGSQSDHIAAIDISDPTDLKFMDFLTDNTYLNDLRSMKLQGKYLYVCGETTGYFTIVDVSDPYNMRRVGSSSIGGVCRGVEVDGSYAYVSYYSGSKIMVFDISNPTSPQNIFNTTESLVSYYVKKSGEYLYVIADGTSSLRIYNASNPYNVSLIGTYSSGTYALTISYVDIKGKYAFITSEGNNSITALDVSDPTSPSFVGTISDSTYLNQPNCMQILGDNLYVTTQTGYLTTLNISNPASITRIGSVDIGSQAFESDCLQTDGRYLYATDATLDSLTAIDTQGLTANAIRTGGTVANTVRSLDSQVSSAITTSLVVGERGISVSGDIIVGGRTNARPTMYLTNTNFSSNHNCDDNPSNCCAAGYHMCTVTEVLYGGRQIEYSGDDRRSLTYNIAGFADTAANAVDIDCTDWTVSSSKSDPTNFCSTCGGTTTFACSVQGTAETGVWCCS